MFSVHLYQPNAILPWNESSSSVSKNLSLERQPVASVVFVSGAAIPAANQPTLGMTQPGLTFVHPFGPNTPHSRCRSLESQLHARNGTKTSYQSPIVLPPFTVLLSRISTGVPPDPYLTLSSLGAGRFQLSDVTQGELDMRLYVPRDPRSQVRLILSWQPGYHLMPAQQTGTFDDSRETAVHVAWRYFRDCCSPVFHTLYSVPWDVLL